MKKKVFGRKLSRERASREALFLSLSESLVLNGKIVTTKAKAKAVIPFVDKLVTLAKKDSLASKRQILKNLRGNKEVATVLWNLYAPIFKERNGGFTRIVALPNRVGDQAPMVRMEFVEKVEIKKAKVGKDESKKEVKATKVKVVKNSKKESK